MPLFEFTIQVRTSRSVVAGDESVDQRHDSGHVRQDHVHRRCRTDERRGDGVGGIVALEESW